MAYSRAMLFALLCTGVVLIAAQDSPDASLLLQVGVQADAATETKTETVKIEEAAVADAEAPGNHKFKTFGPECKACVKGQFKHLKQTHTTELLACKKTPECTTAGKTACKGICLKKALDKSHAEFEAKCGTPCPAKLLFSDVEPEHFEDDELDEEEAEGAILLNAMQTYIEADDEEREALDEEEAHDAEEDQEEDGDDSEGFAEEDDEAELDDMDEEEEDEDEDEDGEHEDEDEDGEHEDDEDDEDDLDYQEDEDEEDESYDEDAEVQDEEQEEVQEEEPEEQAEVQAE